MYAYLRRRGYSADAAQDLTQEFLIRLLEGGISIVQTRKRGGSDRFF